MRQNVQKIIGYHGTKKRFVNSILKDGFKIPPSKADDNHWLGHGIYFYSDYELAEWWSKTKVDKQNKKYGWNDSPIVMKCLIQAKNIWNLDKPSVLEKFKKSQLKLEQKVSAGGVVLDFSGENTAEKIRCFWMDVIKKEHNIDVLIYTFTRKSPSYVNRKYHVNTGDKYSLGSMGLVYHEKQICVTADCFVIDKKIVYSNIEEFDEVIV